MTSADDSAPPPRPRADSESERELEDERLAEIMDVLVRLASREERRQASVGDGSHVLDGISAGLNMVAEEIGRREQVEARYQRRLIEAERAAAVGELAAGIAHEINNPVAYILTNLEALQEHVDHLTLALGELGAVFPKGSDADRTLGDALTSSRFSEVLRESREITRDAIEGLLRVGRVVGDMQSFRPTRETEFEELNLNDVAERACNLIARQLGYRARLVRNFGRIPTLRGDRAKLTQVLTQLLVGAMHAIPEGAPEKNEVTVTTELVIGHVVLSVTDSGPPRPWPALSLSFASDILKRHGGEIRWNGDDHSTKFALELPLHPLEETPKPAAEAEPKTKSRVLIVDDEEALLRAYARLLDTRLDLTLARGGREAIDILTRDLRWDAIVCDLMMPDVDGAGLHEWLRERDPALAKRIVFCTGGAFTNRATEFLEAMSDRVLDKPIAKAKLLDVIERLRPR